MEKDNSSQTDLVSNSVNNTRSQDQPCGVNPTEEHSFDFIFSFDSDFHQPAQDQKSFLLSENPFAYSTPNRHTNPCPSPEGFIFTESLLVNPPSVKDCVSHVKSKQKLPNSKSQSHPQIYPSSERPFSHHSSFSSLQGDRFQIPQRDAGPDVTFDRQSSREALSLDFSQDIFGSPPSVLGDHLLESPCDTPAQFHAARLKIDSEPSVSFEILPKADKGTPHIGSKNLNQKEKPICAQRLSFENKGANSTSSWTLDDFKSVNSPPIKESKMELEEAYSTDYDMLSMGE